MSDATTATERAALDQLIQDLLGIYATTGREVTYVTDRGDTKAYWPHRYLQAVRKSIESDEVLEFVERLVTRDDATRGFGYLQDADRLDLTVEALVVDESKPYHDLFSDEAIAKSAERLEYAKQTIATNGTGGVKLSSRAKRVLEALTPVLGGANEIRSHAGELAHFENDHLVRSRHVLRAAEAYMRRTRKGHDSV